MMTELGLGSDDYLQSQHRQSATVGSINAFSSMRGTVADEQAVSAQLVLSSKALLRHAEEQSQLMRDTLETVRFDETGEDSRVDQPAAVAGATSPSPAMATDWQWPLRAPA